MKLSTIQLHNFRQFYGTSPLIHFASGKKNVTVIHGINGSGKTALLNAFTWVLYEEHTRGFLLPDQLVNKRAIREAKVGEEVECWVEITFENNNLQYQLKRSAKVLRERDENWTPKESRGATLQWSENGVWRGAHDVEDTIERVLPKDLHSYFFFDGERIEQIVHPDQNEHTDLARATKMLLGLEILERGKRHLDNARKTFESELRRVGDTEIQNLLKEKKEKEDELSKEELRKSEIERQIEAHKQRMIKIQERLRQSEGVEDLQAECDRLENDENKLNEAISQSKKDLKIEISRQGYSAFLIHATGHFRKIIDNLRKRGELPAGIKKQFVDDLLRDEVCICGRSINEHKPKARAYVEEWKKRAGLADVEEKALRMGGEVAKTEEIIPAFWDRIDKLQKKAEQDRIELSQVEKKLDTIQKKLESSPQEEIRQLALRRSETEAAIAECNRELGACNLSLKNLMEEIERLQKEISKHKAKEEKHILLTRRVDATVDARDRIEKICELLDLELRNNLNESIKGLFKTISVTPYIPHLSDEYALKLYEMAGGKWAQVAPSQGESQILSFCFIGSIVNEAKKHQAKTHDLPGPENAEFPVVMDSPFGSLDPEYRRQLCVHLHQLTDQVVIFVTKTQWRGEVESTLASKIGRSYVLTYFSPRDDLNKESDNRDIRLNGTRYDLLQESPNDFEYTQIQEASYA